MKFSIDITEETIIEAILADKWMITSRVNEAVGRELTDAVKRSITESVRARINPIIETSLADTEKLTAMAESCINGMIQARCGAALKKLFAAGVKE